MSERVLQNLESMRILRAADIRRAAHAFKEVVETVGDFRIAAVDNIARHRPMVDAEGNPLASTVFGWSDKETEWWKTAYLALKSPLPLACRYESGPFWINSEGLRTLAPNPFLADLDLSNFYQRAMTHAAIVVPVHLPFGQIGAVSYNPANRRKRDLHEDFCKFGDELGLYARAFICNYVGALQGSSHLLGASKLTRREVECLKWAAMGKTDEEIAIIVAVTRATVRFHLNNAATKLRSVNRSQAVFKAAQLGYIVAKN